MFGFRIICIESTFFTTYRHQSFNVETFQYNTKTIDTIIPPEFRLIAYLFPGMLSMVINLIRLFGTSNELKKYFRKHPQFIVACCFTPFMFEGYKNSKLGNKCKIKIWKIGTLLNGFYIGVLPQCILLFSEYYKGVPSWDFVGTALWEKDIWEANDSLIKHPYGNTIFAVATSIFFFVLILLFFGCNCICNCICPLIRCCSSSKPCIYSSAPNSDTLISGNLSKETTNIEKNDYNRTSGEETIRVYLNPLTETTTHILVQNNIVKKKTWSEEQVAASKENVAPQVCYISS